MKFFTIIPPGHWQEVAKDHNGYWCAVPLVSVTTYGWPGGYVLDARYVCAENELAFQDVLNHTALMAVYLDGWRWRWR